MNTIPIHAATDWTEYALLDSGEGEKLEQFAGYRMIRPDPRAIWNRLHPDLWNKADAHFIRTDSEHGTWKITTPPPTPWRLHYKDMQFALHPTDFKHVGIFPEQSTNWNWIREQCQHMKTPRVLNLFGYTGAATVAATKAGAHVTHVDSSKPSITWAHENCDLNSVDPSQTRWIVEDVMKFISREEKRGNSYDGIILDPPRFGRGNKGEVWKLAENLPHLLSSVSHILSPGPSFVLLNAYTADLSVLALYNLMSSVFFETKDTFTFGELATKENGTERFLPQGAFVRLLRRAN